MTSKFELAISTGYVPDWGITEAFRELFQNALDNEITNPENKMGWTFENGTVRITNKSSVLEVETLLLGNSTKANDKKTIGKHGEGYKIAFMVLLRNNKKIKVYNYGKKEVWDVRLVKSKKYNNNLLTTVFIEKGAFWTKTPDNNLTIEVEGITEEEYADLVSKNLHLRKTPVDKFDVEGRGSILKDKAEAGNIYVKGLWVQIVPNLEYGYDFEPSVLGLDRDRKLVDSFNISWEASLLWRYAAAKDDKLKDESTRLIRDKAMDVSFVSSTSVGGYSINDAYAESFYSEHGEDAVPVVTTSEYEAVRSKGTHTPIIVTEKQATIIKSSSSYEKIDFDEEEISLQLQFEAFASKIKNKLSDDEYNELMDLIELIDD